MQIYRIQPGTPDLRGSVRFARFDLPGLVPFRLFYLVPESGVEAFSKTLTHSAATPISLNDAALWGLVRVDITCDNNITQKTVEQERTYLEDVVPDLYRAKDPWWAVIPIPRVNMRAGSLDRYIQTMMARARKRVHNYNPETFEGDDVGQHPYTEGDESHGMVSQIATPRLPPDINAQWRATTPLRPLIDGAQPLPAVQVRTPEGTFENICSLCANYGQRLAGGCWFGCHSCDEVLSVIAVDGFFAKLRTFDGFIESLLPADPGDPT